MLDALAQRVGYRHVRAIAPELTLAAAIEMVVQDQEVANAFQFAVGDAIEFIAHRRIEIPVGKHGQQPLNIGLDQMQAGRFQRLEKPARQADGDHVAIPDQSPAAGDESQGAWLGQRLAVEVREQRGRRARLIEVVRREYVSIADAMLQGNAPLPACRSRRGARVGQEIAGALAGHCNRAIAGQPVRPVFIAGVERFFDQQAPEAGAIDE